MDQRGGCCIARYAGGAYDISKVDRIMLKFRPIAPKPASGSVSGGGSCGSASPENSSPTVTTGRGKRRKAVKRCSRRKRRCSPENTDSGGSVSGGEKDIKTLPLLPESPDVKEAAKTASKQRFPLWLSFENGGRGCGEMAAAGVGLHDPTAAASAVAVGRRVVVASWVRVECVTDTWMVDGYPYGGIGRTDEERVRSLEVDTCPGFVSDGLNRVRWTNPAYRRMVGAAGEVAAWLVVEEGVALPVGCAAAFTCRVRVVTCGSEKASKTVPCDVWRMDCGGFAWRLDTAAALSLWIGN
ncbi:hypothetical protein C2S53_017402 [Perilla frutescens var. hirtella]|uniref:DUF7950 domain-containing protein n=1 Tax=Perilla frutescens var. hirtella TaxID=608512 RepID=A0AAD4J9N9_PERFH|nr:hypothetical protein C2S53_017402 [Perilla frutescens var. hirtella]